MSTKTDLRQTKFVGPISQLSTTQVTEGDNIVQSINDELTPLLRLSATTPTSLVVNVGGGDLLNAESNRRRAIPHIGTAYIQFTSGTVTFPASSGGNITCSPGGTTVLNVASGNFAAVLVYLDGAGNLNTVVGADAATESAAITNLPPAPKKTLAAGFVVVQNIGGTIQNIAQNRIRQFGAGSGGGSGSGDASGLLEDLKNQFVDSYYNFLSAEDFGNTTELVDTGNTTAVYNLLSSSYHMATGQKLTTINLLDSSFFDFKQDIDQAMVTLRYVDGYVDTNPTVKLTRDDGVTWQTVTVSRNGQTDELSGILDFANETLTQTANYTVTGNRTLNINTQQKLAQILTIPANTLKLVKEFTFDVTKTGSPNGKLIVKLVKEASGNPSLLDTNLVSTVEKDMSTISTGAVTVDFGNQVLKPGNYYLLFETDEAYENSFVSGTTQLQIRTNTITPDAKAYNGTTWSAIAGESIQYRYTFKDINLKLEVTASAASRLVGFGVFYQKLNELVSPVSYDQIIVGSSAQVGAGLATHSSLQDALNSVGFSKRIKVLAETISENVTLSQNDVTIEGDGRGSVLSGDLTISGNNVVIEKMRITGNVTINGNSNFLDKVWLSNSSNLTDNGENNSITGILE
jgi:hypothetical protein